MKCQDVQTYSTVPQLIQWFNVTVIYSQQAVCAFRHAQGGINYYKLTISFWCREPGISAHNLYKFACCSRLLSQLLSERWGLGCGGGPDRHMRCRVSTVFMWPRAEEGRIRQGRREKTCTRDADILYKEPRSVHAMFPRSGVLYRPSGGDRRRRWRHPLGSSKSE